MNPALNKAPMIPFAAIYDIKTMDINPALSNNLFSFECGISLTKIGTACCDHLAAASTF